MRKKILLGLFMAAFLLCSFRIVKADTLKSMDTIILLDTSGSMRASDRTRIAIDAVKLYIDMIQTTNTRIGIIAFNDSIVKSIGLTQINDQSQKDYIKAEIEGLAYEGYTDIGMSMAAGVEELSKYIDQSSNPLIILFTDGNIEMNEENPNGRTVGDSYNDIDDVLNYATGLFPIYTVGLNYDNNVDANLLHGISTRTGARSYMTDSATNLPQIFNEIFADFIKSTLVDAGTYATDGQSYVDVEVNIPNPVVSEANIILLSQSKLIDLILTDPYGNPKEIPSEETVFTSSNKYSMLKVLNPVEGVWTLSMRGSADDLVKINLIYNYNLDLIMEYDQSDPSGQINITARLSKDNKVLTDPILYQDLMGTIVIESVDGDKYELRMENMGVVFTGVVSEAVIDSLINDVDIFVKITGRDYNRESNKLHVLAEIPATPEPEPAETPEPTPEPTAVPTEQPVETPAPTAAPTATPQPLPRDGGDSKFSTILLIIIAAFALLAIAFGALFFRKKANSHVFNGNIEVRIADENGVYLPLEIASLSTFAGSAKISDIIMSCMDVAFIENIDELLPILSNIVVKPREDGHMPVLVLNNYSSSRIRESSVKDVKDKNYIWHNDVCIVIKASDYGVKAELTYKADYFNID